MRWLEVHKHISPQNYPEGWLYFTKDLREIHTAKLIDAHNNNNISFKISVQLYDESLLEQEFKAYNIPVEKLPLIEGLN